jgi:hypothetical protein
MGLRYNGTEERMTYRGRVTSKGMVLLDDPKGLREGTLVTVRPSNGKEKPRRKSKQLSILKLAGKVRGLPGDASRNIDHYLYGHPKR